MSVFDAIRAALAGGASQSGATSWPNSAVTPGSIYSDRQRVANYYRFTNIYLGRFNLAFRYDPVFASAQDSSTRANLAARNIDALHSAVWAGVPEPESDDERMTFFSSELLENGKAQEAIGGNILDVALYGDGVFRVDVENSKIRVRTINPTAYFPELLADKPQEPTAHNIIYPADSAGEWYSRERFYLNPETGTWWLALSRFNAKSGVEGMAQLPIDLKVKCSPIIHTYAKRLSGVFYGKCALVDCERLVAEYAANYIKLGAISDMASTKALLAAPYNAFDDKGNLVWDTGKPYMVDDADMASFDKAKFGWIEPPGMALVEPLLKTQANLKGEVTESFGLTPAIFGETGNMRDVGQPGLERVNLLMEFTVNRYQERYNAFLSDLCNVARDFAVTWLSADLPAEFEPVSFTWPEFSPESMGEKAATGVQMIAAGAPKSKALEYMGMENVAELVAQANAETAGQFAFPHSPFDPDSPDPAVDDAVDNLFDGS